MSQSEAHRPHGRRIFERNPARKPFIRFLTGMVFWVRDKLKSSGRKIDIAGIPWLLCAAVVCLFVVSLARGEPEFRYNARGKRNPFIPLVTPDGRFLKLDVEEKSGDLALEGIIFDKNGISYAIVNGLVVKIGDSVNGYQVLRIENTKVTFIKGTETREIVLKKEEE